MQPLGLVGGDSLQAEEPQISCLNVVHTLLFSRTRALAGTGTVPHTPLGSLPCPQRKRLLSL